MVAMVKRTVPVWFRTERLQVEVDALALTDIEGAARLCCDGAANFRAMELCCKIADGRVKGMPFAVYVIRAAGMPVCKIGVAKNPVQRLVGVQVGNWNDLSIASLLWVDSNPIEIEQLALKAAREMGIHLRGEWITAEPHEATELVLKAARHCRATVYDSATWLSNWPIRMHAVAQAKDRLAGIEKLTPRCNL